jgi:hypothetical protein
VLLVGWLLLGSGDSQNDQGGRDDKKAENFQGGLECFEVLNHGENIKRAGAFGKLIGENKRKYIFRLCSTLARYLLGPKMAQIRT